MLLALLLVVMTIQAQNPYPSDTKSPESVCEALLECISVEKGSEVNWERVRNLMLPTAELIWTNNERDSLKVVILTQDDFQKSARYSQTGFKEVALKRQVQQFGQVATVFETFEAGVPGSGRKRRGVNTYQMVYFDGRWWIANLAYEDESEEFPLPASLLPD